MMSKCLQLFQFFPSTVDFKRKIYLPHSKCTPWNHPHLQCSVCVALILLVHPPPHFLTRCEAFDSSPQTLLTFCHMIIFHVKVSILILGSTHSKLFFSAWSFFFFLDSVKMLQIKFRGIIIKHKHFKAFCFVAFIPLSVRPANGTLFRAGISTLFLCSTM